MRVGDCDGFELGSLVGLEVEGTGEGLKLVGYSVGYLVGKSLGFDVGIRVGASGASVGYSVGMSEGAPA